MCGQVCLHSPELNRRKFGLSIINTTKLDMFNRHQQSELFRLKAKFCEVLGGEFLAQANPMYSYALQASPSYAKAWLSWATFLEK